MESEEELTEQQNILVIATKHGNLERIKEIQPTMMLKFAIRALAVRKVTTNRGKRTAGIDNEKRKKDSDKIKAIEKLKDLSKYKPSPIKRVWIPKPGKAEKRPLGIPTLFDRAVQSKLLFYTQ